jgi:starch-binding outer membrane protein, SusD/RagB family
MAQTSEAEVLTHIIADLNVALLNAPTVYSNTESTKGRITKSAIKALLADVYLWNQQYGESVALCDELIADRQFELVDGNEMLFKVFTMGNSSESIFELQFGDDAGYQFNNNIANYYGKSTQIIGSFSFPLFLVSGDKSPFNYPFGNPTESVKDCRFKDFIISLGGVCGIFKYAGANRTEDALGNSDYYYRTNSANWIVYRLTDIMLMKAEALVQLNRGEEDLRGALDMVNNSYLRANYEPGTDSLRFDNYSTPDVLAQLVLRERQRELLFEGKRWFDLMRLARRTGTAASLMSFVSQKLDDENSSQISNVTSLDALYLPVNQAEMDANKLLVQNPFYKLTDDSYTSK